MIDDLLATGPRAVTLMLTTRCNLRCAYCHQDRSRPRTMEVSVLEAAVERLLGTDHARPTLVFFGGEPLLEMTLVRLAIEIVRTKKPPWMRPNLRLFTNGILLDPKSAAFLAEADVHVTLSMDGLPTAQDQRGPGTFAILDEILQRLRRDHPERLRERLAVALTLTSVNVSHLAGSFHYFLSRGVRDVSLVPVFTSDPGWCQKARDELDRQLELVAEESRNVLRDSGEVPFRPFRGEDRRTSSGGTFGNVCDAANRRALFVDVDGSIAPCGAMARSCLRNAPPLLREALDALGGVHVADPNFETKVREREQRARTVPLLAARAENSTLSGTCRDCPAFKRCFICPVSIAWGNGIVHGSVHVPAIQCDFNNLVQKYRSAWATTPSRTLPITSSHPSTSNSSSDVAGR